MTLIVLKRCLRLSQQMLSMRQLCKKQKRRNRRLGLNRFHHLLQLCKTLSLRPFCSLRQFFEPHLLLKRERALLQWLEQHLPQSVQLARCQQHIAELASQCAALSDPKQIKRCISNAHQLRTHAHMDVSEQAEDR